MLSIKSVSFDTSGWRVEEETEYEICWVNDRPEVLFFYFFPIQPDLPCEITQIDRIRSFYREAVSEAGGGLVSVEQYNLPVRGKNVGYLKTILKLPEEPVGISYVGSLTLPYEDFSFVIKAQCFEAGLTGLRDNVIGAKLRSSGLAEDGLVWAQDPYDPTFDGPVLRNLSEDEKFDVDFPDHPLTRTREILAGAVRSLQISDAVLNSIPFSINTR